MPALEVMDRTQKAVLWVFSGITDETGKPLVNAPVELDVRWEYRTGELTRASGEVVGFQAAVVLDRVIAEDP